MLEMLSLLHFFTYVIPINVTQPCFMNFTAGAEMWNNCGANKDYIQFALLPFMWITGGWFSMILASVLILAVWIKYQKPIYPILIGIAFLPISYTLFPAQFLNFAIILALLGLGLYLMNLFVSMTTEQ
jgi:hypothetical protein